MNADNRTPMNADDRVMNDVPHNARMMQVRSIHLSAFIGVRSAFIGVSKDSRINRPPTYP